MTGFIEYVTTTSPTTGMTRTYRDGRLYQIVDHTTGGIRYTITTQG